MCTSLHRTVSTFLEEAVIMCVQLNSRCYSECRVFLNYSLNYGGGLSLLKPNSGKLEMSQFVNIKLVSFCIVQVNLRFKVDIMLYILQSLAETYEFDV